MSPYIHRPMIAPVVIVIDNDDGAECVFRAAKKAYNVTIGLKTSDPFYRLSDGLYLVKTPVGSGAKGDTNIEDLFTPTLLNTKLDGKSFDRNKLLAMTRPMEK